MARYKLTVEYEGTRYSGWQVQKNARTIQGELIGAAKGMFKTDDFEIMGSGRTDAGVHALGQVAHLEAVTTLAPNIIQMKLNDKLPADINVLHVEKAAHDFHARHHAEARTYLYQIATRRTAFGKRYVWWIKDKLNVSVIQRAATLFEGMHDFRAFTKDNPTEKSTKVLLDELRVEQHGSLILFRITGSHFLWNMVRQVIGVLAEAGRGTLNESDIEALLKNKSSIQTNKYTAAPSGLFLERVYYKGDKRVHSLRPTLNID